MKGDSKMTKEVQEELAEMQEMMSRCEVEIRTDEYTGTTSVVLHPSKLDIADETAKIYKARSDRFGELVDVHVGKAPNRIKGK